MANLKNKFLILICLLILFFVNSVATANENISRTKIVDWENIYNSLEEADFDYIFGIDPNQTDEYKKYIHSPYPLFRTGVNLVFKSKTIPPGYYLLTPREKNFKTYVLFKENGRVSYVIPTYEVDIVPEAFYDEKFPHKKPTLGEKIAAKTMKTIGNKKNQRTPIPKAYVEFDDVGYYYNMILYYGEKKYSLIFKKDE